MAWRTSVWLLTFVAVGAYTDLQEKEGELASTFGFVLGRSGCHSPGLSPELGTPS